MATMMTPVPTASRRASAYERPIRESVARLGLIGRYEPAAIEAWMRVEHGTLDALGRDRFDREVQIACDCIDAAAPSETRALVASYGL